MNLEKLKVVELEAQELKSFNGGDNPFNTLWQEVIKPVRKRVLGFFAGITDGISAGLN